MYFAGTPGPKGVRIIEEEVLMVVSTIQMVGDQAPGQYLVIPEHL
jgi:hypothetical protein